MKLTSTIKLNLVVYCAAALLAMARHVFAVEPNAGGGDASAVIVLPNKGELSADPNPDPDINAIRVTFPTPMVGIERIKRLGQPSPVLFDPVIETQWMWVSQTEGKLRIGQSSGPVHKILYRARLRPGLKDLSGNEVGAQNWGAEFMNEKFALRSLKFLNVWENEDTPDDPEPSGTGGRSPNAGEDQADDQGEIQNRKLASPLVAHPIVRLEFSRDVLPQDVARAVYFQDRVTHEKFLVEVNLEERQSAKAQGWFRVEPVAALPPNRSFLLVIDPLNAQNTAETLPHLRVVQAGTTFPLTVRRVVGLNQPAASAFVRVTTNHTIDPDPANLRFIEIQPPVKSIHIEPHEYTLDIHGDFDTATAYRVALKAGLRSTAFNLEKDSVWTVHFHPKRPAVILTAAEIFQPTSVHPIRQNFRQVNTGALEWKVARVPRGKIWDVYNRVREFAQREEEQKDGESIPVRNLATGEYRYKPTEPLIPALELAVIASGTVEASGNDQEIDRQIEWTPESSAAGVYLLEITGTDPKGRMVGNRSIISRTDSVSTQINLSSGSIFRFRDLTNGKPVRGVPVELLKSGDSPPRVETDSNGEVFFDKTALEAETDNPVKALLVGRPGNESLHLINLPAFPSGVPGFVSGKDEEPELKCVIVTDRNMYRPGETVQFKGFARLFKGGTLTVPAGQPIEWRIDPVADDTTQSPLYSEKATLSPAGSWAASWRVPESALGEYFIKAGEAVEKITVSEFRPPPFSVRTEAEALPGGVVRARVSSVHFHGAPNTGAKVHWKAEWMVDNWSGDREEARDDELVFDDQFSQESSDQRLSEEILSKAGWDTAREDRNVSTSASVEGDTSLDAGGTVTLESKSPFPKSLIYGRAKVFWLVDVTSAAAQTVRGGTVAKVQLVPQILGVRLRQSGPRSVYLKVGSYSAEDQPAAGLTAKAEVFRVDMKTVKERLGPNLNRYRNNPVFEKIWEGEVTTPAERTITVPAAGYYMARVVATNQTGTPHVSDADVVAGPEDAELGVLNDSGLVCTPDRKGYDVGDTASIAVQSPYGGTAVVTVETDHILSRRVVELQGNAQRIPLLIDASYAPNAWVCIHLLRPVAATGGADAPAERFGACEIKVSPTDRRLGVATSLATEKTTPGAKVAGTIKVSARGTPVAGADVLIFAVDEAILALGRWKLPDFDAAFFPQRSWEIETHSALGRLWNPQTPAALSHFQKGFILGDTGLGVGDTFFRKDFKALAFWNAAVRTGANGEAPFQFKAPDGLTSYRVVAVAQNGVDQFGNGHATVTLAKSLQVEPALPDFLRNGDEVLLRTVIRQDYADADDIDVKLTCTGMQMLESPVKTVTAKRGIPLPVSFRAKVLEDASKAQLGFSAQSRTQPGKSDAEASTLAINPAVIEQRKTIVGTILPAKSLDVTAAVPAAWLSARGKCDVLLSGSPFLPKLAGLPAMLEGQGSIEKLSTRILAGTLLADAFRYLPVEAKVVQTIKATTEQGLRRFAGAVLEDGGVPVWPGGTKLSEFATVEAAWAILSAVRSGFDVDEALRRRAKTWLDGMISKKLGFDEISPDMRCLALMVRGSTWTPAGSAATKDSPEEALKEFETAAGEQFEDRHELSDEGRAWLALGMHYFDMLPEQRTTLLRELGQPGETESAFDPVTFSSKTRTEAIRLFARSEIESTNWSRETRTRARQSFDRIAQSSVDLSTQENLWLLLVFNSLTRAEISPEMGKRPLSPKPQLSSANGISVGWLGVPLDKLPTVFPRPLQPGIAGTFMIRATYEASETEAPPRDASLLLQRLVRNVTEPARTGSADAPYALGDQILITYRLDADRAHSFLEVEDQLPACFETVNPNHPMVAQYFNLPIEAGVNTLPLSNVELRFARTLLYFEKANPGRNLYSVLARVIAAGSFHWPATQVRPMYDSRYYGATGAMIVYAQ